MKAVAVIGASLAGLSTVRALRNRGYEGRIYLVGEEPAAPYDRPPLSKGFLDGSVGIGELALTSEADAALGIEWLLGRRALALHPDLRTVELADGTELECDGVVIATGARARTLSGTLWPGSRRPAGLHILRTLEDAQALREELKPGSRLVIVGGGFIGAEVASTAAALGVEVTVLERGPLPLAGVLGPETAAALAARYHDRTVNLRTDIDVAGVEGSDHATGVRLSDGRLLPADTVLIAAGAVPAVEWLVGSGVRLKDGVLCDAACATSVPHVVAVGDCASTYHPPTGSHRRTGHWTAALRQPEVAAARLLDGPATAARYDAQPYFWSEQFGVTIQFTGTVDAGDRVEFVEGSLDEDGFVACYWRGELLAAVCAVDRPKDFVRWRRAIGRPAVIRGERP